ncbi:hypothetical protein C1X59_14590 [Pseudomonas sp. FW215-R2]|uniref:hypothetical protein n=1 Tax=unclassified Pseudomonas TaxID=196821 RepID=UPI000C87F4FF|nr:MULTISPECIES: hypothetical protein [unclassified Pseudomonas]PMX00795.1 hypothetical protein C1X59_14590 [Pseudomonas sp. FW215-R2]PMX09340.1 hypothetical protein C1X60_14375 [Pseudomonas sp. FW215-L1]PMX22693.1 hypothetical protein C1X57_14285 [Pseudomonas sp. FW215-E1]PNA30315.1 hypothetical protein C1X58_10935 [Pseudomonas sp. FW215-R4]
MIKQSSYYRNLPDSMPVDDLLEEFLYLVDGGYAYKQKADFMESLLELSDRQWHTYTNLCEDLKNKIEEILISSWDGFDFDVADAAIIICSRLGLVKFFEFMKNQSVLDMSPDVFAQVKSAIVEFGNDVGNPYSGMPVA